MKEPHPDMGLAGPRIATGPRRVLLLGLGWLFVGLAVVGAFLPLLPTTPFLLLASACFLRSSRRLNGWLLRSRLFGPLLRDWQLRRGVRMRVKVTAIAVLLVAVGVSLFLSSHSWPLIALLVCLASIGLGVIIRLPTIRDTAADAGALPLPEPNPIDLE